MHQSTERGEVDVGDLHATATNSSTPSVGTAWFGVAPKMTLVARDWGQSFSFGGRLSATDAMRLSRTTRMVVSRLRVTGGRAIPFAQVGLGQWRIDGDVLPNLLRNTELAAQFGGGLEIGLMRGWNVALETNLTVFYREVRETEDVPQTAVFGTMLASRIEF
jgi:hypothetical protein